MRGMFEKKEDNKFGKLKNLAYRNIRINLCSICSIKIWSFFIKILPLVLVEKKNRNKPHL